MCGPQNEKSRPDSEINYFHHRGARAVIHCVSSTCHAVFPGVFLAMLPAMPPAMVAAVLLAVLLAVPCPSSPARAR